MRLGQPHRAGEQLARFSGWAERAGAASTGALAERCRALLAVSDDAEQHYLAALNLHEPSFEQARTQLLYGTWLRRSRRKAEARHQLRAAAGYLERIGAGPWARRAHGELEATASLPAARAGPATRG